LESQNSLMRILFIHQYYNPEGGSGNDRTRYLAEYFGRQGHEVVVLTSLAKFPKGVGENKTLDYSSGNVRVIGYPLEHTHYLSYIKRLLVFGKFYQWVLQESGKLGQFDLVYACSTPLSVGEAGRRIARKLQVPFIFEVQDVWPDAVYGLGIIQNPILKKILDSFTRRIYQDASAIVALSPDMIPMINRLGDFAGKILVSPNGTDTDMFYPAREKSGERVEFVYAGAIGRANGLESLVRTIQILKKREIKGLHFTILGNGNRYKEVRKLAEGLEDWIEWIPEVSKQSVPEILRRATIGLVWFAPVKELESNSANKFFDYLASGLPIFLNYGGWQAEVLRDAECGIFVLGNEVEVLADGLIEMASDPIRLHDMGLNARELALREYDREALSRKVLACTKRS